MDTSDRFSPRYMLWALGGCLLSVAVVVSSHAAEEPAAQPADQAATKEPATAAELVAAIEALHKRQPQVSSRQEFIEYLQRTSEELLALANKLLAANPDDTQRKVGLQSKLEALSIQGRLGNAEAEAELVQFAATLAADPDPAIAEEARWQLLAHQLRTLDSDDKAAIAKVLGDVRDYVKLKPDRRALQLVVAITGVAEDAGMGAEAAAALTEFAAALATSDDPDVAAYATKLEGTARRLQLLGNPIEIVGTQLNGQPYDLANFKGKVVLIDFWATWCGPCLQELPNVLEAYEAYHERGFEVVGISLDDDRDALTRFLESKPLPWPILFSTDPDAAGWEHPLAVRYGISAIPAVILVDKEGKVVSLNARGGELGQLLGKLIGPVEPPAADAKDAKASPTDGKSKSP